MNLAQNINLEIISSGMNDLNNVILPQSNNLKELHLDHNWDLYNLDITNHTNLEVLNCFSVSLLNIDFTQNTNLKNVELSGNLLTSIDLSNSPNLERLRCSYIETLTELNINNWNNNILNRLEAIDNPNLMCVQVDDVEYANNQFCVPGGNLTWCIDDWAAYSEECELGLEDNNLINFTIYPNPVQDVLFIESLQQIEKVKIYNLQGQIIIEDSTRSVDVSQLTPGLYFVQFSVDKKSITKKFIKN